MRMSAQLLAMDPDLDLYDLICQYIEEDFEVILF